MSRRTTVVQRTSPVTMTTIVPWIPAQRLVAPTRASRTAAPPMKSVMTAIHVRRTLAVMEHVYSNPSRCAARRIPTVKTSMVTTARPKDALTMDVNPLEFPAVARQTRIVTITTLLPSIPVLPDNAIGILSRNVGLPVSATNVMMVTNVPSIFVTPLVQQAMALLSARIVVASRPLQMK